MVSPVGVNPEIVRDGETGFLATSADDWEKSLQRLVEDEALRRAMGEAGRRRVVEH